MQTYIHTSIKMFDSEAHTIKHSNSKAHTLKHYVLNVDKAIYKKTDTCTTEHLRTEFKAKNNIRIFLSTSAYELVKKRLPEHLSEYINNDNLDMTTEMGLDSNNAEVELRFRIVNKLKSGKPGSQLKFTINCYHTSTSILINGSKTDLFVDNILPCIEKEVHSQEDNLSEINNKILISLTSENIRKQDNIDIGEENNTNKEILSIKYIDIDQDMQYVCPICQQQANMDTIACEECDDWFHFECLGLT